MPVACWSEEHSANPVAAPALEAGIDPARSGTGGTLPTTFTTGYRYAGLGYTTVFDAAVAPITARHSHAEFDDTPIVDGGFYILLGNDEYLLRQVDAGERDRARDYAAWMLEATGGYAIKIVNPGGVQAWKSGQRNLTAIDEALGSSRVTPRAILETLADAANTLRLPHPVHIHCNNLGQPATPRPRWRRMDALAGRRAHFTHLQFHCLRQRRGGEDGRLELRRQAGHRAGERRPARKRGRRPGDVRAGHHAERGRPRRIPAPGQQRTEVDQHRRGARDRLRDRPLPVQGAGRGLLAPMGGRPGAVPPGGRSVAGGAVHRSPQWRLVRGVSRVDPAADGPDRARRAAQAGEPAAPGGERAGRRPLPGVHPQRDRHHHARRPRAAARTAAQGPPRRRRGRRRDGVCAGRRSWPGCFRCPGTSSRGECWWSRRASSAGHRRAAASRLAPGYDDAVVPDLRRFYDEYGTVAFDNYPVRGLRDAPLELG